jgi:asparagine synthase (glutamine-hydrolysing)
MCGILAAIPLGPDGLPVGSMARAPAALRAIRHRGPDASGLHLDPRMRFALGHVRLSVQDVSPGADQPFWSDCGRYAIVFNGEIYNFVELRSELESLGCRFRTRSDTEVLLQALVRWGVAAVPRLNGMWAFALVDTGTGEVTVSRDRWGVKPLFFTEWQGVRAFCSEAKGLLALTGRVPAPDPEAVGLFLRFGIGGENEQSWFSGIRRFPVGVTTRFRPDGSEAETRTCWEYPNARDIVDREEAVARLRDALSDSIRIRLRSDVPFGLSLSGGVDSAIIAWLASAEHGSHLDAFTAWYPPKECSELPRAELVAARFGHRLSPIVQDDDAQALENLRTCIYHLDSAHASPAIVPYLNLCRAARPRLTVMLEGQGADELLAGYQQFALFAAIDAIHDLRIGRAASSLAAACRDGGPWAVLQDFMRFTSRGLYLKQADRWGAQMLLGESLRDADPGPLRRISVHSGGNLDEALLFWHRRNLTNLLQYGDAVAMSVNLETRCPFLDWRVVELGFRLSPDLLLSNGFGKHVLRTMADGAVPDEVLWRRRKDGFTNPTIRIVCEEVRRAGWPREGLRYALDLGLLTARISEPASIARLSPNALFRVYSLLLWIEEFQCGKPLR